MALSLDHLLVLGAVLASGGYLLARQFKRRPNDESGCGQACGCAAARSAARLKVAPPSASSKAPSKAPSAPLDSPR